MIVAVVGYKGAGKSEVLDHIREKGYPSFEQFGEYHRLIHEGIIPQQEIVPDTTWTDERLRLVYRHVLKPLAEELVFYGGLLRPMEYFFLRTQVPTKLLSVDVSQHETRYQRMLSRGRDREGTYTYEDFRQRDANRNGSSDEYKFNSVDYLVSKATYRLTNNGELVELQDSIDRMLPQIISDHKRSLGGEING